MLQNTARRLEVPIAGAAISTALDLGRAIRPGWTVGEIAVAGAISFGLSLAGLAALSGIGGRLDRARGLTFGGLLALHLVTAIRAGPAVNLPVRGPLGLALLGIAGLVLLLGILADRPLRAIPAAVLGLFAALALIPIALASGTLDRPARSAPSDAPSVLLVTMDTTRADHVGTGNTPEIDRIAAAGARFPLALSPAPLTGPSHLTILTGEFPARTGVTVNGLPVGDRPASLARILSAQGWQTGAFVGGFPLSARFGFDQGFAVFDDDFSPIRGLASLAPVRLLTPGGPPRERRADAVAARAIRWLRAMEGPFFLWVHFYDPHGPYDPPSPPRTSPSDAPPTPADVPPFWPARLRAIRDPAFHESRYADEIAWTDRAVGDVARAAEARAGDRLVTVITADHGENLGEHGIWFDHGGDVRDPSLRVPLVVTGPGVPPGASPADPASLADIAPTLLDLLGVPDPAPRDGISLLPAFRGEPLPTRAFPATAPATRAPDPPLIRAIRGRDWKCVRNPDGTETLYDLAADPGELAPLPPDARCQGLADLPERAASAEAESEALRALGYQN